MNFQNPFSLDIRSLSLMRIGIGLVLLFDLYIRFSDLKAHYTDQGVLPLELLFRTAWLPEYFSFYNFGNSPEWVKFTFCTNLIAILFLITGYKTRLATVFCWLFLVSIQNRNNLIHQGGDDLLRLILFWGMFLPWGMCFSVDTIGKPKIVSDYNYRSVAGAGYLLLIFSMYFFSALLKNGPEWNKEFTALYYALSLDMIVLPFGKMIYPYPELLKLLTASVYYLELCLPFLLFIPIRKKVFRYVVIIFLVLFHIGISLTLFVGLFPLIAIASLIGLLPFEFWHKGSVPAGEETFIKEPLWLKLPLLFLLAICLYLNAYNFISYQFDIFEKARPLTTLLRIDQTWGMFAPIVFRDDGWFIFEGKTENDTIDLYRDGKTISYSKPELVVSLVKNDRWRKYQENILFVSNNQLRPYYCNWILREWNQDASEKTKVQILSLIYMKEVTLPDYTTSPVSKEVLCTCVY